MRRGRKKSKLIYGHVDSADDITQINRKIRNQIRHTKKKERITELVRRSLYLITLTHSPVWRKKFGEKRLQAVKKRAIDEYERTTRVANRRLIKLGYAPRFDVVWGDGRKVAW